MRVCLLVLAGACGRFGFAEHAVVDAAADATDAAPDAVGCRDGDGICPAGCLGMDDDCVAVCGDGICSGLMGEGCPSCAADCMTTLPVCGNGTCDPGETSATCMPDCGPTPWTFGQLEMDFLAEVNAKRTAGTACGTGPPVAVPAFTLDPADPAPARHNAWEIAHDNNALANTKTCSGAEMATVFANPAGYSVAIWAWNYVDGKTAADGLAADAATCSLLLDGTRTKAMVGAARDVATGWVIYMK